LCHFFDDERYWAIIQLSCYKTILRNYSVQTFEILDLPPDWVCYKLTHKHPNPKSLVGIETFNKVFYDFIGTTELFDDNLISE